MSDRDVRSRDERVSELNAYMRMRQAASSTYLAIADSWNRPKRHNRKIERRGLYWAVALNVECAAALENGRISPWIETASVETRYEVQAGIRTVHDMFPFAPHER